MKHTIKKSKHFSIYLVAFLTALMLLLLFPQNLSAHAILVRSDPARDSTLAASPAQIHMWFSENLNPQFTTAYVVNAANNAASVENDSKTHVDQGNARVSSTDPKEMDLSLKTNLPSAVYVVVYRTQSADDGHILHGSFVFTVAAANGAVPTYKGSGQANGGVENSSSNQLDGPTLWSLVMITLVDLTAIFWAGAQLWSIFVFPFIETTDEEQQAINRQTERRFNDRFALPVLCLFLLANIGVLIGQTLGLTDGQLLPALNPALLASLVTQGHFGTYWIAREVLCIAAIALSVAGILTKGRVRGLTLLTPWLQFLFALFILAAVTLSGHAAATSNDIVVYAVLIDFLHLTAASLWIGGMIYISIVYLPILKHYPTFTRTRSLLTVLPHYSPLAFIGVGIMAITGPLNATTRMSGFNQLFSTIYGRALIVKILLVGALLITSALHVLLLRPRLVRGLKEYDRSTHTVQMDILVQDGETEATPRLAMDSKQKMLERTIGQQTWTLSNVLRWEPALGALVLVCTGLLTVFSGTLQPTTIPVPASQTVAQPTRIPAKPFMTTVKTKDQKFQVKLGVDPNHFGTNTFTATILDQNGKVVPDSQVGVSLYTTMLDMDMGTDAINLQPDGKGHFSAQGDLGMGGNWEIRVEVRTADAKLHGATVRLYTPF
jgi:copper transport protein